MITQLLWTFIILIFYCYFGYPLLVFVLAKVMRRPIKKGSHEPTVSIVMSVYNEEDVIEQKIQNLLSMDYPEDKLEILIGSDGSSDGTDAIIKSFKNVRLHLTVSDKRKGKMQMINDLVASSKSEMIVFTDARQIFAKDAIKQLISNFVDPKIGCVSGELMFSHKEGGTAKGINLYWDYEKFIRTQESGVHSMLGATGAIYAIRRELYTNVPQEVVLDDMFIPLKIIKQGYRAIVDGRAKAFDEVADSPREEHRRKARTLFGNYQIFFLFPEMLIPFKSPIAIQLLSHKLLRVLIPFLLVFIFFLNAALIANQFYFTLFILQLVFYMMAVLGGLARHSKYGILKVISKLCYVPYVFCLLNFSALIGFMRFIKADQDVTWEKARGSQNE